MANHKRTVFCRNSFWSGFFLESFPFAVLVSSTLMGAYEEGQQLHKGSCWEDLQGAKRNVLQSSQTHL